MNNIVLSGRTTRDPELRYTPSNKAVATATLAVNRNYKNQNGEREADFINLVIWGKPAENFSTWIKKGTLVELSGELRTRNYENQQGQRVYVTEVLVNQFRSLETRQTAKANSMPTDDGSYQDNSPFGEMSPMDNITDEDLPF